MHILGDMCRGERGCFGGVSGIRGCGGVNSVLGLSETVGTQGPEGV